MSELLARILAVICSHAFWVNAVGVMATILFIAGFFFQFRKVYGTKSEDTGSDDTGPENTGPDGTETDSTKDKQPALPKERLWTDIGRYATWSVRALLQEPLGWYLLISRTAGILGAGLLLLQYSTARPSTKRILTYSVGLLAILVPISWTLWYWREYLQGLLVIVEFVLVPALLIATIWSTGQNIYNFYKQGTERDSFLYQLFILIRWVSWFAFGAVAADMLLIAFFATVSSLQLIIVLQFALQRQKKQ